MDFINKDLSEFLIKPHPRVPIFYILPKIHKPGFPLVGRPIMAAQNSLHESVSQYIDHILQPFVRKIPTFIQDTTYFIRKVEGILIPSGSMLLSLDVVALYTNIPHEELRETLRDVFDRRDNLVPPTHFLLDLVDVLIEKNYFIFNENYYLQINGVAMSSAFAPSAANLYMSQFEQQFILNPTANPYYRNIKIFYQYINDIFCIYADQSTYKVFDEWLNQLHPTIKFTASGSHQQVNYLDTKVFRTQGDRIAISPFRKETDRNTYLHFKSFHSRTLHNNIPYGQFLRIKRNSSEYKDFNFHRKRMQRDFLNRGYPKELIKDAERRAEVIERKSLLMRKDNSQ